VGVWWGWLCRSYRLAFLRWQDLRATANEIIKQLKNNAVRANPGPKSVSQNELGGFPETSFYKPLENFKSLPGLTPGEGAGGEDL